MRGAVQTGLERIEVLDVPQPVAGEGIAVVRVRAAGICGSDLHPYHGRTTPQTLPEGHEVAGEVVDLPGDYRGPIQVGDLVAVDTICYGVACGTCDVCQDGQPYHCPARWTTPNWGGGFAETIRRRTAGLFRLPPGLTAEQGALVEPFTIGVHAMRYARVAPGASVAIVGAGTIGLMMLIAARAMGAGPVHILARHPHQAALAEALGAATVSQSDSSDAVSRVRAETGGKGADVVVETVGGHADTFGLSCDLVRRQGMVIVLGIFPRPVPTDLLKPVDRELWTVFLCCYGTIDGRADFDVAIDLIASGRAPVERLVTHRLPLESAPEAFRTAADKSTGSVKVHLVM
jgi:threonine dehydrogenase-like Zn-dependent dehydrogenase